MPSSQPSRITGQRQVELIGGIAWYDLPCWDKHLTSVFLRSS